MSIRNSTQILTGKRVLVTAGPTREYIDPVRFISNASSGTMGYALAREARDLGAQVILISGPTHLTSPANVRFIAVVSARDMKRAVDNVFPKVDYVVSAAAVSDFRPAACAKKKIKNSRDLSSIRFIPNPDILAGLGKKKTHQKLIGFALETNNIVAEAKKKLMGKNLDLIYANSVDTVQSGKTTGFIIGKQKIVKIRRLSKPALARRLWAIVSRCL